MVNKELNTANGENAGRLLSLDVMRGLIMILLCAESCLLWEALHRLEPAAPASYVMEQFFHHPWHGLHLWDLVQPAFMFMAGSALYISYSRKLEKGISWSANFRHVLLRSLKLFICGTGLHCIYSGKMVWELWNVLTQLSITTIIAYLIIQRSALWQTIFSIGLLLLTEILYRFTHIPGYDQPFVEWHNFGVYVDSLIMPKVNDNGWVTINAIPTAVHTIWGVLAGKLLISLKDNTYKIKTLLIAGLICLLIGFGLDSLGITPIIKRISTSSFVFASGGWVLLCLAFLYWLIDIKQNTRYVWIFTVMGMNAIFIYLFFETIGMQWLNQAVNIFTGGLLQQLFGVAKKAADVISALSVWFLEWGLCYWLYTKKIFFKL